MSKRQYIRNGIYNIESVLSKQVDPLDLSKRTSCRVEFDGDLIRMDSHRYWLFSKKGLRCVSCGLEGKYFVKEKSFADKRYHFNLYGTDTNGKEVMLTKDHIQPKSKGGKDHLDNYQTMCTKCNHEKGCEDYDPKINYSRRSSNIKQVKISK